MNTKCVQLICCRNSSGKAKRSNESSGTYGHLGRCDIPIITVQSFIDFAYNNIKPDFILYLGDVLAHNLWEQKQSNYLNGLRKFNKMLEKFNVPVYQVLGNHEGYPLDQFDTEVRSTHAWIIRETLEAWDKWIDKNMRITFIENGCYSKILDGTNLKLIALSPFVMISDNTYLYRNQTNPLGVVWNYLTL